MKQHEITLCNIENALLRFNFNRNFQPKPNLNAANRENYTGFWIMQSLNGWRLVKYKAGAKPKTVMDFHNKAAFHSAIQLDNELDHLSKTNAI